MILATARPVPQRFFRRDPGPLPSPGPGEPPVLKVIASSVVLAVLGALFIVYNEHDDAMVRFGWFLVVLGALVAAVFSYLYIKRLGGEPEPEPEPKRRSRRR